MTGWFEANKGQPISRVTVGALDDLGVFTLDYSQADDWPYIGVGRRRAQGQGIGNGQSPDTKPGSAKKWEVLQTKTSFYLPNLMEEITATNIEDGSYRRNNLRA
jgi:hypothetical protein